MWDSIVRNVLFPAHEALMGRSTMSLVRRLATDVALGDESIASNQIVAIRSLLQHASATSSYWRLKLEESGRNSLAPFCCDKSEWGAILGDLPILTRAEVRRFRETMRSRESHGKVIHHSSSGTTDDNLIFYLDRERQAWDRASRIHALARLGVHVGEKQVHFMPQFGAGGALGRVKDMLRVARDRVTRDPAFDLRPGTPARLDAALAFLRAYRPAVIVGYPSGLFALAQRRLQTKGATALRRLRYVLSTGELLYDFQRRTIESAFGARVVEEYGSQELGVIASEDASGQWLINSPHVVVEVLRGERPARAGEMGEIIVTSLHSHVMPFVRYATGDIVTAAQIKTSEPGKQLRILPPIEGRSSDVLLATDGHLQGNRALVDFLVRETDITEFSLHQTAPDRLLCMTVSSGGWVGQEARVTDLLRSVLGRSLQVEWKVGAAFQPLKSGKRRYVCSPAAHVALAHDLESGMFLSRAWPQRVLDAA
jgi:phenylacetate-CoA ligase